MGQLKRKAVMADIAEKAKEADRNGKHALCTRLADEWVKLATVNDMVRAPMYLKWKGRLS